MELEDDVFFADLSKRIALLIAEDEEDVIPLKEFPALYLPVPAQGHAHYPYMDMMMMPPMHGYDGHGCRRESRGTGVFIPKSSSLQRRKVKQPLKPSCQTKPFSRTPAAAAAAAAASDFNQTSISKSEGLKKPSNA